MPVLGSLGAPLISALLLALVLKHFLIPLLRYAVLPRDFHSSLLLLKSAGHSSYLHVPHHPLCLLVDERGRIGSAKNWLSVGPLLLHLKEDASKCQWCPKYLKCWKN